MASVLRPVVRRALSTAAAPGAASAAEATAAKTTAAKAAESTVAAPAPAAAAATAAEAPKPKKGGFFSTTLIGFFAGLAGATAVGYYFLKNDYEQSTGTINTDITKLVTTVEQLRDYIQRVETVERELKRLQGTVALKQEVDTVRVEVVRAVDNLQASQLRNQAQVWALEEEVLKLKAAAPSSSLS